MRKPCQVSRSLLVPRRRYGSCCSLCAACISNRLPTSCPIAIVGRRCSDGNCIKTAVSNGLCWAHGGGALHDMCTCIFGKPLQCSLRRQHSYPRALISLSPHRFLPLLISLWFSPQVSDASWKAAANLRTSATATCARCTKLRTLVLCRHPTVPTD